MIAGAARIVRGLAGLVALATLGGSPGVTQTVTVDRAGRALNPGLQALPVHVGGRVVTRPLTVPPGGRAYLHQWPGIYWEARSRGDRLLLRFDDRWNEYRLLVDGRPPIRLAQPGRALVAVAGLGAGPHRVRLEKVTESVDHVASFDGFYVPAGHRGGTVAPRARQIEFVGDSSMSGYGARSPKRQCSAEEIRLLSDSADAYPVLVAKHFDADYQINATSGRGVVRNYGGSVPDAPLPRLYPFAFLDRTHPYADPAWRPQIVVVKLTADLSTPLNPGERWPNLDALYADYIEGYGRFVAELHRRSPEAAILIWWFDSSTITDPAMVAAIDIGRRRIADAARRAGVSEIDFLPMTDLGYDRGACDSHPSLADHRKTAAWLTAWLTAHPGLWRGR